MSKILISWLAFENDFIKGEGRVNPQGPNSIVHKLFYNYDYHILLTSASSKSDDTRLNILVNHLNRIYKHDVRPYFMDIKDVIDIKEISVKVQELLLYYKSNTMDIFISPGTPTMQVAWYLAHFQFGLNTNLFQIRPKQFSKSGIPEQVFVDVEKSTYTSGIVIKQNLTEDVSYDNIKLTNSIKPIYDLAYKVAATEKVTVLILGETGTGKENLAHYIHQNSTRNKNSFITVNCSSINDQLLESRLFGYKKGAFTDAKEDTKGLFEDADRGTIFLDEIGDISEYMQKALLRVLQEKK